MRNIVTIALFFPFVISAASFGCAKATKDNEKLICNSPKLSSLDEELSSKYKIAIKTGDYALRADQINWIKSTNKACKTEECLSDIYIQRIKIIETWNEQIPTDKTMQGNFDVIHPVFVVTNDIKDGIKTISDHDCLSINKIDNSTIKFSLKSVGDNAHLCSISGTATLKNGVYFYNKKSDILNEYPACNLTISNRNNSILINDPDNGCKDFSCGMGAILDGLTFSKNLTTTKPCEIEY